MEATAEHTIEHAAFVEMVLDARQSLPDDDGDTRLRRLVEHSLGRAKRAGRVTPEVAPDDVLLAQRMAYGVVTTAGDGEPTSAGRSLVRQASRVSGVDARC